MRIGTLAILFISTCLIAPLHAQQKWGDLSGRFAYGGEPPKPTRLLVTGDDALHFSELFSEAHIVHPKNRGIANIVIYLLPGEDEVVPIHPSYAKTATVTIDVNAGKNTLGESITLTPSRFEREHERTKKMTILHLDRLFLITCLLLTLETSGVGSDALDKLAGEYKIQIDVSTTDFEHSRSYGPITGAAARPKDLAAYEKILVHEFSLYPKDFVKRSKLKSIVLCTKLAFDGQRRNGVPDFEQDMLYLEVTRGNHAPIYMRRVIHHEFFHLVDYKDDGKVYKDDHWLALNQDDFRYGKGGKTAQDDHNVSLLTDKIPGFLNRYATSGIEEDKAELFSFLVVQPGVVVKIHKSRGVRP